METNTLVDKKVLVTGGCGFIGTNLALALQAQGAVVTVLDLPKADWGRLPKTIKKIKADILNPDELTGVFSDSQIIYHLAAKVDLDGKTLEDYAVNTRGTKNILKEVQKSTAIQQFIFYSTILVTGIFNDTRFINESEPYRTRTLYGQSKIDDEKHVIAWGKKTGIPYTIIRPASVYGPWGEEPYRDFFATIKKGRYVNIGKADNLVSWVYVGNLVNQTIAMTLNERSMNEIFYGSDFQPYTMKQIVTIVSDYYKVRVPMVPNFIMTIAAYSLGIFKYLGVKVPIYPFRLRNITASYCYSMVKSANAGYKQEYDLRIGIITTLDWYEARKML